MLRRIDTKRNSLGTPLCPLTLWPCSPSCCKVDELLSQRWEKIKHQKRRAQIKINSYVYIYIYAYIHGYEHVGWWVQDNTLKEKTDMILKLLVDQLRVDEIKGQTKKKRGHHRVVHPWFRDTCQFARCLKGVISHETIVNYHQLPSNISVFVGRFNLLKNHLQPPSPGHAGDDGVVAHLVSQATGHVLEQRQRMLPQEACCTNPMDGLCVYLSKLSK